MKKTLWSFAVLAVLVAPVMAEEAKTPAPAAPAVINTPAKTETMAPAKKEAVKPVVKKAKKKAKKM